VSCKQKTAPIGTTDRDFIETYLDTKVMEPSYGGRIFSSYKVFLEEGDKIYVWAFMQEKYKKDGSMLPGSGWSVPLVLNIGNVSGNKTVISHTAPRDGELFSKDIETLFPEKIRNEVLNFTGSEEMQKLEEKSRLRSKNF